MKEVSPVLITFIRGIAGFVFSSAWKKAHASSHVLQPMQVEGVISSFLSGNASLVPLNELFDRIDSFLSFAIITDIKVLLG